ncbi:hypothetical protein FKW77_006082 [Venturia effusa]|uniref:Signal recognition particle subunit n=1 Tax=Venturia effusa TaxID=50376 RepID=A0A517LQH1_9PEZI|nr:hypothetical protein FKW77_006082 [Venturia effusa]
MSNHARIEEVSDSDEDVQDPDEGDIMDLATFTSSNTFKGPRVTPPNQNQSLMNPSHIPSTTQRQAPPQPRVDPAKYKHWHCIYPIYFDASKTREEGRRAGKDGAVKNPLARTIVDAVARLGLNVVFEPEKVHPKDWSNPGRIRVELKDENGKIKRPNVKNKRHLYLHISAFLKDNPTTENSPMELPMRGMPMPDKPPPPPAVPRGWKINEILPLHSAAVTGGGVSEDLLKEMMGGMGGPAGTPGPAMGKKAKKQKIIRA